MGIDKARESNGAESEYAESEYAVEEAETWWNLSDNVNTRERLEVFSALISELPDDDLEYLFAKVPKWVLTKLASEPLTPVRVLDFLAREGPESVQWRVAINRNSPLETVKMLAESPRKNVRDVAMRHYLLRS